MCLGATSRHRNSTKSTENAGKAIETATESYVFEPFRARKEVLFSDVEAQTLEFTYGPGFTLVNLREPPPRALQGEVDYVLWPDRNTSRFVHIEAAVKFYLASKEKARRVARKQAFETFRGEEWLEFGVEIGLL